MAARPKFETFEHTADIGLYIYGRSLKELFTSGAEAILSVIAEPAQVRAQEERRVDLVAENTEALLRAWLAELVFYLNSERWLAGRVSFTEFEETALEAVIEGEPLDVERHELGPEVKAVTWHKLKIDQPDEDGWLRATVILDV